MINLIPIEEKKRKVKDFYFRLAVVFFAMLGFCAFVASASLLPAYFISVASKNLAIARIEAQKREPVPSVDQGALATMENASNKMDLIEKAEKNKYLVSQKIINEILLLKMSDIKINRISYDYSSVGGKEVKITGLAPSREELLLFRRALEDSPAFKNVDLPISNFVKGSDIEFYLSLIPS
jgi:Tfp pilus assembly protein PilN